MADDTQNNAALASLLEDRLIAWEKAREPQEKKLLECYQDVMRIPRDDDTAGTGAARTKKTKGLFIGSTRNKVRAARAKINDALFGNGQMPFDTSPTNEELAEYADVVEKIITEQMSRGDFKAILKTGVNTLATYGTGFVFGPFVRKETLIETTPERAGPTTFLKEEKYEFDLPYFELANTLDVYPDPEARDPARGRGVFWVTMESKDVVAAWRDDKSYKNINQALLSPGDRGNETGSETASQMRGNVEYWHKGDRIKVARYFGKVPRAAMAKQTEPGEIEAAQAGTIDVIVIMAGGVVVKVSESPYGAKSATHRCLYEAVEHEMWGVGVADNNAAHQRVTNAAFRLFMEGKGMALLGTSSVDRSKFLPTEDFRKFPGKVYQMKPGLTADERNSAIIQHAEPDITGGWIDVIRMSEQFSDDDTGITKYTQGDDSRNLNKTATGISMIMSASALPIKEVIQNIDDMWIEPIVECYIDWNLKYLEPETVQKIHGDEAAELWAQIKQLGKSSFMDWQATGTSSFMQKEVLTNKIRAFSEFALGNPVTAPLVDARELLQQTWDVMEIGRESPILEAEGEAKIPPQVQQQMQQMQEQIEQLGQALEAASDEVDKLEADRDAEHDKVAVQVYDAETRRAAAMKEAMTPEMVQALITKTVQEMMFAKPLEAGTPEPQQAPEVQDQGVQMEAPMAPPQEAMEPEFPPQDGEVLQ